jgi:uracil-DNA glycosylase
VRKSRGWHLQNSLFDAGGLGATPHLQPCAGATTAFVFSCPGQKEELLGHPCAGATGRNLDAALPKLHTLAPKLFASSSRAAYVLTNSWSQIEYPAKTGRSEATAAEILSPDNLNRLERELAGITTILICGQKAKHAVLELQARGRLTGAKVAIVMHLSPLAVNSHAAWRGKSGDERLALWAQAAVSQLRI